jgi:hypothetical protein
MKHARAYYTITHDFRADALPSAQGDHAGSYCDGACGCYACFCRRNARADCSAESPAPRCPGFCGSKHDSHAGQRRRTSEPCPGWPRARTKAQLRSIHPSLLWLDPLRPGRAHKQKTPTTLIIPRPWIVLPLKPATSTPPLPVELCQEGTLGPRSIPRVSDNRALLGFPLLLPSFLIRGCLPAAQPHG